MGLATPIQIEILLLDSSTVTQKFIIKITNLSVLTLSLILVFISMIVTLLANHYVCFSHDEIENDDSSTGARGRAQETYDIALKMTKNQLQRIN